MEKGIVFYIQFISYFHMKKHPLALANIISFITHFILHVSHFFIPLFLLDAGFKGYHLGILMSLSTITGLLFTFPMGKISDSVQARKILAFGIILIAIFFLGLSKVTVFWILIIIFLWAV